MESQSEKSILFDKIRKIDCVQNMACKPNPNPAADSERHLAFDHNSRLRLVIQDERGVSRISDSSTSEKCENILEPKFNKGSKFRMTLQAARDDHFFADDI